MRPKKKDKDRSKSKGRRFSIRGTEFIQFLAALAILLGVSRSWKHSCTLKLKQRPLPLLLFFSFFNGIRLSWSDFCVGLKYSKVETYVCLKCSRSLHWGFYVLWFLLTFVMLFVREQDNTIQYNTIIQFHMQENTLSCSKYLFPSWNAIFPPFCVCVQHSGYYFQILWAIRDTCEKSYIF